MNPKLSQILKASSYRSEKVVEALNHLDSLYDESKPAELQREVQHELYWLYNSTDLATQDARSFVAGEFGQKIEKKIPRVRLDRQLDHSAFTSAVRELSGAGHRLSHPLSSYLKEGKPSKEQMRYFVLHNWYRVRNFYRLVGMLSQRMPLKGLNVIYGNLLEESGGKEGFQNAHPVLFQRLLKHFAIESSQTEKPDLDAGIAYLNNRERCMRSADFAWGLALFFAIESTSQNFEHMLNILREFGLTDEETIFYRLHSSLDADHEQELLDLLPSIITTQAEQEVFLSSLQHHQRCTRLYFDAIWDELQKRGKKAA